MCRDPDNGPPGTYLGLLAREQGFQSQAPSQGRDYFPNFTWCIFFMNAEYSHLIPSKLLDWCGISQLAGLLRNRDTCYGLVGSASLSRCSQIDPYDRPCVRLVEYEVRIAKRNSYVIPNALIDSQTEYPVTHGDLWL